MDGLNGTVIFVVENTTTERKNAVTPVNSATSEALIAPQNAEVEGGRTGTAIMRRSTGDQGAKKSSQATEHLNLHSPIPTYETIQHKYDQQPPETKPEPMPYNIMAMLAQNKSENKN